MRRLFIAIGLLACASASFAVPIRQDIIFTPSLVNGGPAGVGSLVWDADTNLLTEVTWDFGLGRTGGILPSILALPLADYTWGGLLYEQMIAEDFLPPFSFYSFSFGAIFGSFPAVGAGSANFGGLGTGSYEMITWNGDERITLASGMITVVRRSVPEPATWALLAIGLAGILLARRKVAANY